MSNFPPPPNRFPAPPGVQAGRFPPPPGAPPAPQPPMPSNGGTAQLTSDMGKMSLQQPQQPSMYPPPPGTAANRFGPPPPPNPGQATFQPPQTFQPPPPAPGYNPPAPGYNAHSPGYNAPKPGMMQPPPAPMAQNQPPVGGPHIFMPGAPGMPGRPGAGPPGPPAPQIMQPPHGAQGGLTQPANSAFYQQPPSAVHMDRVTGTPPAPTMAGQVPAAVNSNIDYSIRLPDRIFRVTTGKLPASATQATACKVPLGAILRPLAPLHPDEPAVDTVQPGTAGIVRCKRCRTYINAFVVWSEHGRRWLCNICGQLNDCPSAYFCHLDERGLRRDRLERPELSKAVVEYIAPAEYMVRPPQEPAYFFVLDVSATAVRSGMLQSAARAIKASLDDLPGRGRTKIGFITFDNAVHYYNLSPDLASPQMLVVSDLKQLFVPLPEHLLVNLRESRTVVEALLDNLPEMFAAHPVVSQSCLGSALKAAFTVMKEVGGKMCIFQSIMPNIGDGILKPREQPAIMGTPNEVKLLKPETTWYKDTAIEFSRQQISVDIFLFPYQYMDLSALGELAKFSAGTLHSYPSFNMAKDSQRFEEELNKTLTQTTAFEAVMRIRCTKGMKITNFYGNFFIRGQDLMALPNCNTEAVFGFDLAHDEQNVASNHITVQAALLYTSSDGERRIRVMTQALPVTSSSPDVIASVDTDACICLLSKQALEVALKTSLDNARMRLQQMCVDIVRASKASDKRVVSGYTVPGDQGGPADDRPLPENLQLLPLYTLATMKNVAFRGGTDVHPDERVQSHYLLNSMFVTQSKHYIYPRMFEIHNLGPDDGYPINEPVDGDTTDSDERVAGRNRILLPPAVNLSVDRLTSEGIFLLDNGVEMYLWVGRTADFNVMSSLFGTHTLDEVDANEIKVNMTGDQLASRFGSIVQALREDCADPFVVSAKINVVREGDTFLEGRFFWFLVEDRASFQGGTHSYEEFMHFVSNPNASSGPRPPPGPGARPGAPGMPGGMPPSIQPPAQQRGMPPGASYPPPGPQQRPGMNQPPPQPSRAMGPPPPHQSMGPPQPHQSMGPPQPHQNMGPPQPHQNMGPPQQHQNMGPPPPQQGTAPPPPRGMAPPQPSQGALPPPPPQPTISPPHAGPPGAHRQPPVQQGYGVQSGSYSSPPPAGQNRGFQQGPPGSASGGYGAHSQGPPSGGFGGPPIQAPSSGSYGALPTPGRPIASGPPLPTPPRHAMPPPPPRVNMPPPPPPGR